MEKKNSGLKKIMSGLFLFALFFFYGTGLFSSTDALYIYHMGESDKAVIPIVISIVDPPEVELFREFGEVEGNEADLFKVDKKIFEKIFKALNSFFSEYTEDDKSSNYGSFRFTIIMNRNRNSRVFSPEISGKIAKTISGITGKKFNELSTRLKFISEMGKSSEGSEK